VPPAYYSFDGRLQRWLYLQYFTVRHRLHFFVASGLPHCTQTLASSCATCVCDCSWGAWAASAWTVLSPLMSYNSRIGNKLD
jgi:hypothetical protein